MRISTLSTLTALALLSGCSHLPQAPNTTAGQSGESPDARVHQTPKPMAEKRQVTFVDLDSFDKSMEQALASGAEEVEVVFLAPVSPNAIPPRLGRWLNTLQEQGGNVNVQNENRTRSLSLLATLADAVYSAWKDMRQKNLVKNVDADMQVTSSEIKKLSFKRRG